MALAEEVVRRCLSRGLERTAMVIVGEAFALGYDAVMSGDGRWACSLRYVEEELVRCVSRSGVLGLRLLCEAQSCALVKAMALQLPLRHVNEPRLPHKAPSRIKWRASPALGLQIGL